MCVCGGALLKNKTYLVTFHETILLNFCGEVNATTNNVGFFSSYELRKERANRTYDSNIPATDIVHLAGDRNTATTSVISDNKLSFLLICYLASLSSSLSLVVTTRTH